MEDVLLYTSQQNDQGKRQTKLLGKSLEEAFELNKVPEFFPQGKVEERTAVPWAQKSIPETGFDSFPSTF